MGFLLDAVVLSAGFSGLRRMTGINVSRMLTSQMKSDGLRAMTGMYFKVGDIIVDTGVTQWQNYTRERRRRIEEDNRRAESDFKQRHK